MRVNLALSLLLLAGAVASLELEDLQVTDGIGELTDGNFKEFIGSHKYVLVLFYSRTCGLSNKALEYYSKISEKLIQENLKMPVTKIDVDLHPHTANHYGIKGVPMLKLFVKTYPIPFQSGSITPNVVYEWVETVLTNKYSDELKSLEDVKEIEELNIAVILYLPKTDVEQLEDYNHVAGSHESIPFYYTHNEKHAKYLKVESKYGLVIVRNFDDGNKIFGGDIPIDMNTMADFLKMFSTPLIEDLSQDILSRYSDNMGIALLFFAHGKEGKTFEEVQNVCFHRHISMGCIFGDKDLHETVKFLEDIGSDPAESTAVYIVHFKQKPEMYRFDGELTFDNLDRFVVGFFQKSIPRYYKSQLKMPENKDMIPQIAGKDFDEMVINHNKTMLVQVKSEHCTSCGQWKPILQDMLISFAGQGGFSAVTIDGEKNEHQYLIYESIPALLVYLKKDKTKPIEYKGNKNLPEFKEWLSKTLKIKLKDLREQSDDKKKQEAGLPVEEEKFEDEPQEEVVIDAVDDADDSKDMFDEGTDL